MKIKLIISTLLMLSVLVIICLGSVSVQASEITGSESTSSLKGRVQASPEYVLGAGDILQVFDYVTREDGTYPENIQDVPILPDGTATIVPIGQVRAEGLTLSQLNQIVRDELSKTIRNPRIFVSVAKTKPMDVYIIGAVLRPGHYSSDLPGSSLGLQGGGKVIGRSTMTVTSALEQAGGLKSTANVKGIILYRKRSDEKFNIDLWKLLYEGDITQDVLLQSGDVLHIPEVNKQNPLSPREQREIARSTVAPSFINVQVLGAVNKPGIYQLPPESDMVVAIASAGGPKKEASNNVFIARVSPDGSIKKIKLKLKKTIRKATSEEERIKLYPQDLIYVKHSAVKQFTEFASETVKGLVRTVSSVVIFDLISN